MKRAQPGARVPATDLDADKRVLAAIPIHVATPLFPVRRSAIVENLMPVPTG